MFGQNDASALSYSSACRARFRSSETTRNWRTTSCRSPRPLLAWYQRLSEREPEKKPLELHWVNSLQLCTKQHDSFDMRTVRGRGREDLD